MAILVLISTNQIREPFQFLGDVVGIYEDDYPFTPSVLERFDFLTIRGTREDVERRLQELDVQYAAAYLNPATGKYQFDDPMTEGVQQIQVWSAGDNKWYQVVEPFKFRFNIGTLTAEEKQLLSTIDIFNPSVDAAAKKIIKDLLAANPANGEEVRDLRNKTP